MNKVPQWMESAACRGSDPALFAVSSSGADLAAARAMCRTCSVALPCRSYGHVNDATGIFGGERLVHGRRVVKAPRRALR
jgi:hypothetical protein